MMELKSVFSVRTRLVLRSFNRTMMELKWEKNQLETANICRFNRTMMELKFASAAHAAAHAAALIEP